jgi:hypothetical protein
MLIARKWSPEWRARCHSLSWVLFRHYQTNFLMSCFLTSGESGRGGGRGRRGRGGASGPVCCSLFMLIAAIIVTMLLSVWLSRLCHLWNPRVCVRRVKGCEVCVCVCVIEFLVMCVGVCVMQFPRCWSIASVQCCVGVLCLCASMFARVPPQSYLWWLQSLTLNAALEKKRRREASFRCPFGAWVPPPICRVCASYFPRFGSSSCWVHVAPASAPCRARYITSHIDYHDPQRISYG